jgi:hypothetical protein
MIATTEPMATGTSVAVVDKPYDRISWGAIWGGTAIALSVMLVLSLIGIGVGLSTLDPQTGDNPSGQAVGIGAVIWWAVSSLISLFVGGMIAGRAAASFNGHIHGLITWATVTLLSILMLTSAIGSALAGATGLARFATNLVPQVQQRASEAASTLQNQANNQGNQPTPQQEQQAREVGEKAATGGAIGAFGTAACLLLGALAASFGGHLGRRSHFRAITAHDRDDVVHSRA